MLHGLGGDTSQFDSILPFMTCPGYEMVRIDMRGHGATPVTGTGADFTFRQLALDVTTLLRRLACAAPLIGVGVSMGAGVLATIALAEPGAFSRLFLIRPAWEDLPNPPHLRPFQEVGALLGSYGSGRGAAVFLATPTYRRLLAQSPYAAYTLLREFAAPHAITRRARLQRMPAATPFDSISHLQKVTIPVTVVATPWDPLHPVPIARHWAEHLPQARLELIPPKALDNDRYSRHLGRMINRTLARAAGRSSRRPNRKDRHG
jgi:pimeloyl-ACP methyl ester carboxylesterase